MVAVEFEAEGFDDEVVVFALRKAGDGDAADDSGAIDVEGKAAAVRGVVGVGEAVAFGEGAVVLREHETDGVGAAMKAGDHVRFTLHPARVVRSSARKGCVEERLVGLAEAADVDDDGLVAGDGQLAEGEAKAPSGVVVEVWEVEFGLLTGDGGEVFGDCHGTLLLELQLLIAGDAALWNRISAGSQGGGFSGRAKLGIRPSWLFCKGASLTGPCGYAMLRG